MKKSLYSLKQSLRVWFKRFNTIMKKFDYQQDKLIIFCSPNMRRMTKKKQFWLCRWMIITKHIRYLKKHLRVEFEAKELGILPFSWTKRWARSRQGILISQRKPSIDLLKKTKKLDCKPTRTSLELNWKRKDDDEDTFVDKER